MTNRLKFPLVSLPLLVFLAFFGLLTDSVYGQQGHAGPLYTSDGHINGTVYKEYETKTKLFIANSGVSKKELWSAIQIPEDQKAGFKKFIKTELFYDKRELIIKVGEGQIKNKLEVLAFFHSKDTKYKRLYTEFQKQSRENEEADGTGHQQRGLSGGGTMPFAPGQPCQNMDFETQTLAAWNGSYGSSCDPIATAGFNNLGTNSATGQHTIMTSGTDLNIPAIPCVMPGGSASLRLGDNGGGGNMAARIDQTFMVNAANPYFTYNYAVVLEDAGHVLAEQPYFRIRMYDGTGALIDCATLDVDATNAPGLLSGTSADPLYGGPVKYSLWTQVVIPLNSYIGQNVKIEFTTADCNNGPPSGGGHDGYAYIDCSCNPPNIFTSSPTICGGTSINISAPSGLSSYNWTGPGIVGANNTQTVTVNVAGTYSVSMTTATTAPHIPCTFTLDTIIPGNPASPVAGFTSDIVCQGLATTFTDTSTPVGSINGWAWDFDNNGTTDDITQNPTHIFPAAGTYTVNLVATWGGCTDNFSGTVTVNPGTPPAINPAGPFCTNAAATTLTATIAGGTWGGPGITNTSTGAFDPALAAIGNNTITYTTSGACGGTTNATIVINPLPISNAGPDVTICSGAAASIGTATTAGYTYSWSPAAGLSSTTISNPSITTVNGGTVPISTAYTVTTTSSGCTSTDNVTVTVNPQPVLTITNPPGVCTPGTVDITAASVTVGSTGGGVFSYWNDLAATSGLAAPNAIATSGTYYIKVTATGGCTDIDPVTVTINPLPVANAGPDVTICDGTAASIGVPATAGQTYSWTPTAGLSSSTISNPSITTTNPGTTPIVTNYTVTTTITATGCQASDAVTVTVNPQPVLTITNPAAVCSPGTVDITAAAVTTGSTGGGVLSYWNDAGATSALAAPNAVGTTGIYYIKVTAIGGCTDIKPVTVTINPLPLSNAGPDVAICDGSTATIGTVPTAGNTYSWSPAAGLSSTTISNPSITTTVPGSSPIITNYTVTTTITATGCQSTDVVTVEVDPLPVLTITDPAAVCAPGTVDITAAAVTAGTTGGGTLSYWTDAAGTIALATPNAVAATGIYYIKATAAGGCSDIGPVNVTINPLPVSVAGPDVIICTGGMANLGGPATAGLTYSWSPVAGLSSITASNPTITLTNLAVAPLVVPYIVTTTNATTGCQSADTVVVTVNSVATANAGSSQSLCSGSTITLGGAVGGSATSGTWSGGAGTFSPNANTLNAVYTPTAAEYAADSVTLTLTTNDPTGPCTFASSGVTFYFYKLPTVAFSVDVAAGCPVHCVNFTDLSTVSGGDNIATWLWNFGDGSPVDTMNAKPNPSHCFPTTGYYDVTLTVTTNHGCVGTMTQIHMVQVYAIPDAEFATNPNPVSILDPIVNFTDQSTTLAPGFVNYWYWNFGDGDTLAPASANPTHQYPTTAPGTYTVTLTIHNNDGCWDSVSHDVIVEPEFTFYIPNAFTPNGDGTNDYFFGTGIGIVKYDIWIFDRWGNMIYHSDNLYNSPWDGHANHGDDVAQQDVYVWKVRLTDCFEKKHSYIGTVTLVK